MTLHNHTQAGVVLINLQGYLIGYGWVWFLGRGISNKNCPDKRQDTVQRFVRQSGRKRFRGPQRRQGRTPLLQRIGAWTLLDGHNGATSDTGPNSQRQLELIHKCQCAKAANFFYCLNIGHAINRNHWTKLPVSANVIEQVPMLVAWSAAGLTITDSHSVVW